MKSPFLVGSKVYLRPLELDDAPLLVTFINDPDVTRTLAVHRPLNLDAERDFVERMSRSEHDVALGVVTVVGDRLIGTVGLHRIDWKDRHAAFGIAIGIKAEWGSGYGTESTRLMTGYAFDTLNLHRVWLHVYDDNPSAIRVYEKVGYRREGILRQSSFRNGRYRDTISMAILREEWAALRVAGGSPGGSTARGGPAGGAMRSR